MTLKLTTGLSLGPIPEQGKATTSSVLQANRLLRTLSADQLSEIMNEGRWETLGPGDVLCEEGALVESVYFIVEGCARTLPQAAERKQHLSLADFFGPGEAVGLLSLIDGAPYASTVHAIETTRVLAVPLESLRRLLHAQADWYRVLAEMAVSRLRAGDYWLRATA